MNTIASPGAEQRSAPYRWDRRMRYWWMNQKQTDRYEVPGGCLWPALLVAG